MPTTLLIVEKTITKPDLDFIAGLHSENADDDIPAEKYVVVVPVGRENGKILAVLDDLALADFDSAARDTHDEPEQQAVTEARTILDETIAAFQAAGLEATGELIGGDLLKGLKGVASRHQADEIIVLTLPHFVEDALHRDLASRVRRATDLPTLRLLAHVELG